ncbi:hypothetical protein SSVRHp02 [Sulfolobus virus Ragged Hills]|uniref:ORF C78 n=1 Tax=Sulfolobus virus Ragged Hills TaxID=256994 RepID=Q6TRW2_9VIRU|nr:hypothetical protein SSVRHp02 [Sulfolobus virus Ragged Hills]AAR27899.1 ORF C78 [Sulfolobus virus Ragged Hills]
MKVIHNDIRFRKLRIGHTYFRYNYAHYCTTIQKAKAQTREINIRPQNHKAIRVLHRRSRGINALLRPFGFLRKFLGIP